MEPTKHTPTPWEIDPLNIGTPWNIGTKDHNILLVAETSDRHRNANTAFIVKAVNSHEELLEVVKRLRSQHHAFCDENNITDDRFHLRLMDDTDKAIKKAEASQ